MTIERLQYQIITLCLEFHHMVFLYMYAHEMEESCAMANDGRWSTLHCYPTISLFVQRCPLKRLLAGNKFYCQISCDLKWDVGEKSQVHNKTQFMLYLLPCLDHSWNSWFVLGPQEGQACRSQGNRMSKPVNTHKKTLFNWCTEKWEIDSNPKGKKLICVFVHQYSHLADLLAPDFETQGSTS